MTTALADRRKQYVSQVRGKLQDMGCWDESNEPDLVESVVREMYSSPDSFATLDKMVAATIERHFDLHSQLHSVYSSRASNMSSASLLGAVQPPSGVRRSSDASGITDHIRGVGKCEFVPPHMLPCARCDAKDAVITELQRENAWLKEQHDHGARCDAKDAVITELQRKNTQLMEQHDHGLAAYKELQFGYEDMLRGWQTMNEQHQKVQAGLEKDLAQRTRELTQLQRECSSLQDATEVTDRMKELTLCQEQLAQRTGELAKEKAGHEQTRTTMINEYAVVANKAKEIMDTCKDKDKKIKTVMEHLYKYCKLPLPEDGRFDWGDVQGVLETHSDKLATLKKTKAEMKKIKADMKTMMGHLAHYCGLEGEYSWNTIVAELDEFAAQIDSNDQIRENLESMISDLQAQLQEARECQQQAVPGDVNETHTTEIQELNKQISELNALLGERDAQIATDAKGLRKMEAKLEEVYVREEATLKKMEAKLQEAYDREEATRIAHNTLTANLGQQMNDLVEELGLAEHAKDELEGQKDKEINELFQVIGDKDEDIQKLSSMVATLTQQLNGAEHMLVAAKIIGPNTAKYAAPPTQPERSWAAASVAALGSVAVGAVNALAGTPPGSAASTPTKGKGAKLGHTADDDLSVHLTASGTAFHLKPNCGQNNMVETTTVSDARERGYVACGHCAKRLKE